SNIFQLMQRKNPHTGALLNRVPDTVTSLGLLVVDGFRENRDWLSIDDMLAPLSVNPEIAVIWLGEAPINSIFFDAMISNGQILYDERSLSEIVLSLSLIHI
ncbi:hypothetical protein, partial [Klebsiella pneumoniae]|uniref:hypothetical protein n=1 Tax=Klebsiella pneumoniae TaxID=573 RepID=UPI002555E757